MSSKNNNSDLFNEIKTALDALPGPDKLNTLSRIEVDLIRDRLRKLYDLLSGLEGTEHTVEQVEEKTIEFEVEVSPSEAFSPAAIDEKIQQSESDPQEIEYEELVSARLEETGTDNEPSPKTDQPDLFSMDDPRKKKEKKAVIDVISDEEQKESIADQLQKNTKVESLKKAIGINEKFFLINELFEGNLNEYNAAIEALDNCTTMDEAMNFFREPSDKFNWNEHAEAVDQLKQFLERKFK
jgi:hypothetical protein